MPYAASHSRLPDTRQALETVCREVSEQLGGALPDLSFLFVSRSHAGFAQTAELACELTRSRNLLGCTAETVIGAGEEVENGPIVSLWSAVLPGAELETFHVEFERTPDGLVCIGMPELGEKQDDVRAVFLLGDPFSCAIDTFIDRLADDWPGVALIGGMASGGRGAGENQLYLNGTRLQRGGVGVIVRGGPAIRSIVSQGCRQIGTSFVVTKSTQNVVFELGGKPALQRFQELFQSLNEHDRELVQSGLHIGIVMDEYKPFFNRGDFLISNVIGADKETGAIAIGNTVRTGQTVQFHIRDAQTADEDLRHMLSEQRANDPRPAQAALLFSCNGRGTRLFPAPNHDAGVVQELCGPLPLAGFFAQGELGPVMGKNYIHGFTASVAVFNDGGV